MDDKHFISDFNSSNGTYLDDSKLTPFKLYMLTDNAELRFGDVSARYSKVSFNIFVYLYLYVYTFSIVA